MNLEICERECDIEAVIYDKLSYRDATICDKHYHDRADLPCQKGTYRAYDKYRKPDDKPGIRVEEKEGIELHCMTAYFKNHIQTKCFHVPKDCPFYVEHTIFDEN